MIKQKIGTKFMQSGYGRSTLNASVYLINGFAYARSAYAWKTDFNQLEGELKNFVRVNAFKSGNEVIFYECSDHSVADKHRPYTFNDQSEDAQKIIETLRDDRLNAEGRKNSIKDLYSVPVAEIVKAGGFGPLRDHARASIERRKFESLPGVIHHPDGVLEIPLTD